VEELQKRGVDAPQKGAEPKNWAIHPKKGAGSRLRAGANANEFRKFSPSRGDVIFTECSAQKTQNRQVLG
jgi:hypothetical protein